MANYYQIFPVTKQMKVPDNKDPTLFCIFFFPRSLTLTEDVSISRQTVLFLNTLTQTEVEVLKSNLESM